MYKYATFDIVGAIPHCALNCEAQSMNANNPTARTPAPATSRLEAAPEETGNEDDGLAAVIVAPVLVVAVAEDTGLPLKDADADASTDADADAEATARESDAVAALTRAEALGFGVTAVELFPLAEYHDATFWTTKLAASTPNSATYLRWTMRLPPDAQYGSPSLQ